MDLTEDVPAGSSPAPEDLVPDPAPSDAGVDEPVGDRPARNILAEVDRKWGQRMSALEAQQAELLNFLRSQNQPRPTASASGGLEEMTDDQLTELAQAGHVQAHLILTKRYAAQSVQDTFRQSQQVNVAVQQRNSLFKTYPVFTDSNHPLTQYAMRAKALLVQNGANANDAVTDVDAMKTAIADNPQIVAQHYSPPDPEPQRRSAVSNATTIDGSTQRRQTTRPQAPQVTDEEWTLAKRYGYKTREQAAKAKVNFDKRQSAKRDGTEMHSSLGAVSAFIREG